MGESKPMTLGLYTMFERNVTEALGDRIQASDQYAKEFWSALANQGWVHKAAPEREVSYSFRAAGDLIARIRGTGHYMDWYMCGPDGVVAPWISEAMAKLGWQSEGLV
jgi:hypothetical protein